MQRLKSILKRIDGRGYKAYKDIEGVYRFHRFDLSVDHVQGDPFAAPSRLRVIVPHSNTWLTGEHLSSKSREIAVRDYITRVFAGAIHRRGTKHRGSGKSGSIAIDRPGQEVLDRSSCLITQQGLEIRFTMGLPAAGRRILAKEAMAMFFEDLPAIMDEVLSSVHARRALEHCEINEDADFLRGKLREIGLVAFVAEGAILPRESGIDQRPMSKGAIPFGPIPDSLRVEIALPNRGRIVGMGIPEGVTLIVGGGYHGKSTLLNALSLGIYNHVKGDGREFVVMDQDAVTIRSEDGRRVEKVDISIFISNLPMKKDTSRFSTDDASGSTSQAANIMEAIEAGARVLLIDEDTSANNFLVRDFRMQKLVTKDKEPITPFIDRVRQLYETLGISTVIVLGGSGDYLDVADTVIQMDEYHPVDVTKKAKEICKQYPSKRKIEVTTDIYRPKGRIPLPESFDPSKGRRAEKVKSVATRAIIFGHHEIDISFLEQYCHPSQTRLAADLLLHASKFYVDGKTSLISAFKEAYRDLKKKGFDSLTRGRFGDRAWVRIIDVVAAANRLRTLKIK